ncbi:hypothetical protein E2C01_078909 [Portunus trituberculatus]|uniref:Uncharacterized protein n=1 Tax=Portunus trituberculatus TaxID=210409 RepID=A0A5B7IFL7_PORTR|nr:hypothetical protein [Portunus trituberculatus]
MVGEWHVVIPFGLRRKSVYNIQCYFNVLGAFGMQP